MVVDKDQGMRDVTRNLRYIGSHAVKFGWVGQPDALSKGEGSGSDPKVNDDDRRTDVTVAYIARAHEQGRGPLKSVQPPRAALTKVVDGRTIAVEDAIAQFMAPAIEGRLDAEVAMRFIGEAVVDLIRQQYVSQEGWKPLSERRRKQKMRNGKRGDQARINTGQELNAVRYEVEAK